MKVEINPRQLACEIQLCASEFNQLCALGANLGLQIHAELLPLQQIPESGCWSMLTAVVVEPS
jgi:hypothetical protein